MYTMPDTGCAPFDRQSRTGALGTGNVWSSTQFSNFIRPKRETRCNGFEFPWGHLQACDLAPYSDRLCPAFLRDIGKSVDDAGGGILYRLQHFVPKRDSRPARHVIHGYILTDKQHHVLRFMVLPSPGAKKSRDVLVTFRAWLEAHQVKQAA